MNGKKIEYTESNGWIHLQANNGMHGSIPLEAHGNIIQRAILDAIKEIEEEHAELMRLHHLVMVRYGTFCPHCGGRIVTK